MKECRRLCTPSSSSSSSSSSSFCPPPTTTNHHHHKVLARISLHEQEFQRVLNDIVALFSQDRRLLETRGSLIIRRLCVLLNAKSIYISLAQVLSQNLERSNNSNGGGGGSGGGGDSSAVVVVSGSKKSADLEFTSIMVQTLNLILLTALEVGWLGSCSCCV
jgi:vacuole morphology and inheritance protein 14